VTVETGLRHPTSSTFLLMCDDAPETSQADAGILEGNDREAGPLDARGAIPVNIRLLPETAEHYREILRRLARERAEARAVSDRNALDRTRLHVLIVVSVGRELGFNGAEQARLLSLSRQRLHALRKQAEARKRPDYFARARAAAAAYEAEHRPEPEAC
jgi:hypothetical protein